MTERKKRKLHSAEFKAKVGLEAVRGVQTSNKISQEFGRGLACHDLYRKQIRMFHYPTYWDDFTIVA